MTRVGAVQALYDHSQLPPTSILGAFAILGKARLPLTPRHLAAAAFIAYKTYEISVNESILWFRNRMMPESDPAVLKADEMRVLEAVSFNVPSRTRMECVHALALGLGVRGLQYQRAAVLSLLVEECDAMEDELYSRAVLCAAVQLEVPDDRAWMRALPSAAVPREVIMRWGLRIAAGRPTSPRGQKRAHN